MKTPSWLRRVFSYNPFSEQFVCVLPVRFYYAFQMDMYICSCIPLFLTQTLPCLHWFDFILGVFPCSEMRAFSFLL